MKIKYRIGVSILIIFCMIAACGCSSNKENIEKLQKEFPDATITEKGGTITMVRPVDFDAVEFPTKTAGNENFPVFKDFERLHQSLRLHNCVVLRGKKTEKSLQITYFDKDMQSKGFFSITPITVLEAYYGDVQAGGTIYIKENAAILTDMSGETAVQTFGTAPIKGEEEYIFVLQQSSIKTPDGEKVYGNLSNGYPPFLLDEIVKSTTDKNTFLEKKKEQTFEETRSYRIGGSVILYAELLEKYYYPASPDVRLDEAAEMRKMIEVNARKILSQTEEKERLETLKNDTTATKEQLLKGLTDEQAELLERMVKQYGTLESAAVKE